MHKAWHNHDAVLGCHQAAYTLVELMCMHRVSFVCIDAAGRFGSGGVNNQ